MSQRTFDSNSIGHKDFQFLCMDYVRFVLSLLIVLIHTFALSSISTFTEAGYPLIRWVNRVLDAFLAQTIVPVYFFISGYLFFLVNEWNKKVYFNKIKKRVHTLLIPYLLWNGLGIIFVVIKQLPCFDTFISVSGTCIDFSFQNILSCFYMYNGKLSAPPAETTNYAQLVQTQYYPINTALWYVRDLMAVVACTPVLHFLLKKIKAYLIIVLGILYLLFGLYHIDWHIYQLTSAFLFFSCGAFMSLRRMNLVDVFGKYFKISCILYPLCSFCFLFLQRYHGNLAVLIATINMFVFIAFVFNVISRILCSAPQGLTLKNIGASGVFIYMAHCLVLPRILKVVLYVVTPETDMGMAICYICTVLFTIILLISTYRLLRKHMASVLNILIGRT